MTFYAPLTASITKFIAVLAIPPKGIADNAALNTSLDAVSASSFIPSLAAPPIILAIDDFSLSLVVLYAISLIFSFASSVIT